jgi:type I phosphodiesterase/nucleotide pyrophosphatase
MEYRHALTETAPAHAALYTGKTPRENGITANDVRRDDVGSPVASLLRDPDTKLIGASGAIPGRPGISLTQLTAETLSEALLDRDPQSVVISISTKDRGAAFAGARIEPGQRAPAVVWWDPETAGVVTSSAFAPKLPAWVRQPALPREYRWEQTLSGSKLVPRVPDDRPGESEDLGGRRFPHVFAMTGRTFRVTPEADRLTVDLALAAVEAEKTTAHPMLLALSLSRYDYVGHRFGPDSWEAWQALVELDRELARLFSGLDASLGKDAYSVLLTADHGIAPLPESVTGTSPWCAGDNPYELPCEPGVRLRSGELTSKLREAGVDRVVDSLVYLREGRAPDAALREALRAQPGIAEVFEVCAADPARSEMERSVHATGPACVTPHAGGPLPAYYLVQKRGSFFAEPPDVAGHGTPYRYDRLVPLLVNYAGGGKTSTRSDATFRSFHASLWYALTGVRSPEIVGP